MSPEGEVILPLFRDLPPADPAATPGTPADGAPPASDSQGSSAPNGAAPHAAAGPAVDDSSFYVKGTK